MRDLLSSFYKVRTDAPEGTQATPRTSLEELAAKLPHGSGLDGNWWITIRRDGGLTLRTDYHAMNDNGYYVGWFPVVVVLNRKQDDHGLELKSVRVNERKTNGAGDWIADCVIDVIRGL